MKVLLLLNSNKHNINSLEHCTNKTELFVFMIKSYIQNFEGIELFVENCLPCTEMKSTFKSKNINNFTKVDHIILVDECGLYKKTPTFILHLKNYATTISTFCKNSKFYNGEDMLFTYDELILNKNAYYIKPPIDDFIYAPRKEDGTIYILLDKEPNEFMITQIYKLLSINKDKNNIIFKIGIINTLSIDYINITIDTDNELSYHIYSSTTFNLYVDYIYELSKANIFFSTNTINDTYLLYELAMCNTLHVLKSELIQNRTIIELDICTYDDEINWKEIFNKLNTYNIREKLISNNYTWNNALTFIFNKYGSSKSISKSINPLTPIKKGYCLNIKNKNKAVIVDLNELKEKEVARFIKPIVKKKVLLQSQLLKK